VQTAAGIEPASRPTGRRGWPLACGGIGSALLHAGAFAGVLIAFDGPPSLPGGMVVAIEWAGEAPPRIETMPAQQAAEAAPEPAEAPAIPSPAPPSPHHAAEEPPAAPPDLPAAAVPEPIAIEAAVPAPAAPAAAAPPPRPRIAPASRERPSGGASPKPPEAPSEPSPPGAAAAAAAQAAAAPAGFAALPPDREAQATYAPAPAYPPTARRRGVEGRVIIRLTVAADGVAASATVVQSSGDAALDEAALAAARRWRFDPALRGGAAAAETIEVPFVFRLSSGTRGG